MSQLLLLAVALFASVLADNQCASLALSQLQSNTRVSTTCGSGSHMEISQDSDLLSCGDRAASFVNIRDAKLSSTGSDWRVKSPCSTFEGDSSLFQEVNSENGGIFEEMPAEHCDRWIEEPTLLVHNPRHEYMSNMYHNLEEVFSVHETLHLLNRKPQETRVLFTWAGNDRPNVLQLLNQVHADEDSRHMNERVSTGLRNEKRLRPQLLELWDKMFSGNQKFEPIRSSDLNAGRVTCFKNLILPCRACTGSVVALSWDASYTCPPASDSIAVKFSRDVVRAFGYDPSAKVPPVTGRTVKVLMLKRSSKEMGKRTLENLEDAKDEISKITHSSLLEVEKKSSRSLLHEIDHDMIDLNAYVGSKSFEFDWTAGASSIESALGGIFDTVSNGLSEALKPVLGENKKTKAKVKTNMQQHSLEQSSNSTMAHRVHVNLVDFSEMTMAQQIAAVREADVMIGQHGAGMTHAVFLRPGAAVIEVTPFSVPSGGRSVANIFMNLATWTDHPYEHIFASDRVEINQLIETVKQVVHNRLPQ